MSVFFTIVFLLPLGLWALGGFNPNELARELPKIIGWYVVFGGIYLLF